ncbi:MAG: CPBP family intramembrane metalloprotease [Bacteroidales bacterium]|nr:CPBP family intramembrane metalloprotease [Candidatus Cacconaster merdequi]
MTGKTKLFISIIIASVLWFWMFSPWTSGSVSFWVCMSCSAVILTVLAFLWGGRPDLTYRRIRKMMPQIPIGIFIAFALWGIFWVGYKLSGMMFDFAGGQVDAVYGMKDGSSPAVIALLLLFLIGPAEEYFWRGYVQKTLTGSVGPTVAMVITAIIYALVHIWSFNFMLVMAALVAGSVWGLIYRLKPSLLPALVLSHALWDALVFVILPIG